MKRILSVLLIGAVLSVLVPCASAADGNDIPEGFVEDSWWGLSYAVPEDWTVSETHDLRDMPVSDALYWYSKELSDGYKAHMLSVQVYKLEMQSFDLLSLDDVDTVYTLDDFAESIINGDPVDKERTLCEIDGRVALLVKLEAKNAVDDGTHIVDHYFFLTSGCVYDFIFGAWDRVDEEDYADTISQILECIHVTAEE